MKIKEVKVLTLNNAAILKGFTKNGLDSSRFINLILCFESPEEFKARGYSFPPNLFYLHKLSVSETYGVLINKFNINKKEAAEKINSWLDGLNIHQIDPKNIKEYKDLVAGVNKEVIADCGEDYLIKSPDIRIIASFIKEGINLIHVKDKGFEETCKRLNINIIETPLRDLEKERKIKDKLDKN